MAIICKCKCFNLVDVSKMIENPKYRSRFCPHCNYEWQDLELMILLGRSLSFYNHDNCTPKYEEPKIDWTDKEWAVWAKYYK